VAFGIHARRTNTMKPNSSRSLSFQLAEFFRSASWKLTPLILLVACTSFAAAVEPIPLRAGPLTMVLDVDNVLLRYVRVGEHEVLRGINAPVRDQNWATVAPSVSNIEIVKSDRGFKATFDVHCREADIDFRWKAAITGSDDGVIEFTFDGEAHSTFRRNRIGFCVLHGPTAAGQPWVIETVDGKSSAGHFPKFISPHQPAKNLRAIAHQVAPGIRARVEFEGEVFEMEDQRNWTDASFKTYCTPLEIPYPVEVPKGTKISQKLRISVEGERSRATEPPALAAGLSVEPVGPEASAYGSRGRTVLTMGKTESALPRIGLQVSSEVEDLTERQLQRLRALHLDHLRVDLALSDDLYYKDLRRAIEQAKALGVTLHIGLNLGDSPDFAPLLTQIRRRKPAVSFWLVSGGQEEDFAETRRQLAAVAGGARIGVTRITNFVDLNRTRPQNESVEAVGFAINPQIHAFDNPSIIETLPVHADVVNSARQFAGDRPLVIGPMTLRPLWVDGEDPPGGPLPGPLPTNVDARQVEPFTAAWTLGSVKYLAEAGAHSATYFETVGWNGIMDIDDVSARPAAFPSRPGQPFPVYHLLKEIGEFAGGTVRQIDSSDVLSAVGLALLKQEKMRVLVANLTAEEQTVALQGLFEKPVTIEVHGGKKVQATPQLAITIPPYTFARIDRVVD
jgi:hypothetical protein